MSNSMNTSGPVRTAPSKEFESLVAEVPEISKAIHTEHLLAHAEANKPHVTKSFKDLMLPTGDKGRSAVVVSAGPSVRRRNSIQRILESGYKGTVIAADGAYVACLKAGLVPDYVITLDPHKTRVVRWFGDPNFETHSAHDDYFARQDLDVEFRKNSAKQNQENIELVNKMAPQTKAILCAVSPLTVTERVRQANFDTYWWNPLVDDPYDPESLTRKLYNINKVPAINTGGNVGTAAWVFACATLKIKKIALVGMDFGYYSDLPYQQTQYYYELINRLGSDKDLDKYFVHYNYPGTGERFYSDAPYAWYRKNFLELWKKAPAQTFNCTEGGTLFSPSLPCVSLEDFFANVNG